MTQAITITPTGQVRFLYADELSPLMEEGPASIRRASHVEPHPGGGWGADLSPVGGPPRRKMNASG